MRRYQLSRSWTSTFQLLERRQFSRFCRSWKSTFQLLEQRQFSRLAALLAFVFLSRGTFLLSHSSFLFKPGSVSFIITASVNCLSHSYKKMCICNVFIFEKPMHCFVYLFINLRCLRWKLRSIFCYNKWSLPPLLLGREE